MKNKLQVISENLKLRGQILKNYLILTGLRFQLIVKKGIWFPHRA
jgi:hypothetical protein